MWHRFLLLALVLLPAAFAADDDWAKVKALASGTELRILKTHSRTALLANLDQATDESLIIATKTEQISIPKDEIQKIEYRPRPGTPRIARQSTVDRTPVNRDAARPTPGPARTSGPSGSASSSLSMGGKAEFLVVWVRPRGN